MARTRPKQNTFNSGEWRPELVRRDDLEQYEKACQQVENFIPVKYGGAYKRRGLEYMDDAYDVTKASRLERFIYDNSTPYVLEFADERIKFWKNGTALTSIESPYGYADIFALQFCASFDVVYITHPDYPVYRLDRNSDSDWEINTVTWSHPPFLNINSTDITMAVSATSGSTTLTASAAFFDASHEGAYFAIEHPRSDIITSGTLNSTTDTAGISVLGDWTFTTRGVWGGTCKIQRSYDNGSSWQEYRVITAAEDNNEIITGTETIRVLLRISFTFGSGTLGYQWNIQDYYQRGTCVVTAVNSTTSATVTVIDAFAAITATKDWYEGAFSAFRGYPVTAIFHGERLWFGKDQQLYGSVVGDYQNFLRTGLDDSSIRHEMSMRTRDIIRWLQAEEEIIVGTSGGIYSIPKPTSDEAITPGNMRDKFNTAYDCGSVPALPLNNTMVFTQRENRILRELTYDIGNYKYNGARELTLLSGHITGTGGLTQIGAQQHPSTILWGIRTDGEAVSFTYEKDEGVYAFARHVTDGEFISVATASSSVGDELWFCVKRTIGGSDKYYIERMQSETISTNVVNVSQYAENVGPQRMQFAVLFDVSGSMTGDIETFRESLYELISELEGIVSELTIGLVLFGNDDNEVVVTSDFITPEAFRTLFDDVEATSGSVEDGYQAIADAVSGLTWSTADASTVKTVILITDEDADEDATSQAQAIAALDSIGAVFYYGFSSESDYGAIATATGGDLVTDSGDFADNFIEAVIASQFSAILTTESRPVDYLDSSVKTTGTVSSVSGLDHLEGETVYAVGDGAVLGTFTVDSGSITLDGTYSDVRVGLLYSAYLKTMPYELYFNAGTTQGRKKSVARVDVGVFQSLGLEVGTSVADLKAASITPSKLDSPAPLVTENISMDITSGNQDSLSLLIASRTPLPMNVTGIYPILETRE